MPLANLETGSIARCLAQVADRPSDHVDAFFEVRTESRVSGAAGELSGQCRVESGLAVRLLREGRSWLASSDEISPEIFARALARVARARPGAMAPPPRNLVSGEVKAGERFELEGFVRAVESAIQKRHAAFPIHWDVRSHCRWSRVVGDMLSPSQQQEAFFSCAVRTPWGRWGALLIELDEAGIESVADSVTSLFRARRAPEVALARTDVVLAPAAAAVLLHEAVAHALETDTLSLTGNPEAAVGVRLASETVDVLDDPAGARPNVRRTADDEGMPVVRRWLLRGGVVEQPLADLMGGGTSDRLVPGAARRAGRHLSPVPRSTHLELLPGSTSPGDLVANCGDGLQVPELSRGSLDPLSGELRLDFPYARRIEGGRLAGLTAGGRLRGSVVETLGSVAAVGDDAVPAGAGWCAKGGQLMPVWATAPSVLMTGVEVSG